MRFGLLPLLLLVGASVAVSCGSSSGDGRSSDGGFSDSGSDPSSTSDGGASSDSGALPAVAAESVCVEGAKRSCAFLAKCSSDMFAQLWAAPSDCDARLTETCTLTYPNGAVLRGDDVQTFVECMGALTCDALYRGSIPRTLTPSEQTFGCARPRLKVTKPLDAPCSIDQECESGACSGSSVVCGRCTKRLLAGATCADGDVCPREGGCDGTSCYAPAYLGDPCDKHNVCGSGLLCTGGKCVKAGSVAAACGGGSGKDCDTIASTGCNYTTAKCEPVTFVQPGDPCGVYTNDDVVRCTRGSLCIRPQPIGPTTPGTCMMPGKVGYQCGTGTSLDNGCESGLTCHAGKCALPYFNECP